MAVFHPSFLHFDLLINRMPFVRFSHVHYLHVGDGFQWQTYCECCSSSQESIIILDVESCGLWVKAWHEFLLQFLTIHGKKFPRPYLQLNSYKSARVPSVICLNCFQVLPAILNGFQLKLVLVTFGCLTTKSLLWYWAVDDFTTIGTLDLKTCYYHSGPSP